MQRRRWWLSWAAIWALGGCPRMVDDGATGSDETMRAETGGADSSSDTAGATLSDEGEARIRRRPRRVERCAKTRVRMRRAWASVVNDASCSG